MIRSVFLGTPSSAVPSLAALTTVSDVVRVITRADRPKGRTRVLQPTAVRCAARARGLPVSTPTGRPELAAVFAELDVDVAVVAAFGMIIPPDVLSIPARGMINVHFSLLPRWRGAAPVERAILAGDPLTGVTAHEDG